MASVETIGERRCAHRASAQSSTSPVRQDLRILHFAHGQGGGRVTRPSSGLVLGHKRQKSSGKSRRTLCSRVRFNNLNIKFNDS